MRTLLPVHRKNQIEQKPVIYQFRGDHRFLSNFWNCDVVLPAESGLPAMAFNTVENAYMAWKTPELALRQEIQKMKPGKAKLFSYTADFPYRDNYTDESRVGIMRQLIEQKYSLQNPELMRLLLETKDALIIEGNVHCDTFFGFDLDNGYGQNYLGRLIMSQRRDLMKISS